MSRRAERLHRGGPARKEKNVDIDVDVNVDVTTLSETALVKSSRNIRTGGLRAHSPHDIWRCGHWAA